jgi:hypothetical protein
VIIGAMRTAFGLLVAAAMLAAPAHGSTDTALARQILPQSTDFKTVFFRGFDPELPNPITAANDYGPPYCRGGKQMPRPTAYASSLLSRYRVILTGQSYQGIATAVRVYATPEDATAAWGTVGHEAFAKCLLGDKAAPALFTKDGRAVTAKPVPAVKPGPGETVAAYRLVTHGELHDTDETNGYLDLTFVKRGRVLVAVSQHAFDTAPFLEDRMRVLDAVRKRLAKANVS